LRRPLRHRRRRRKWLGSARFRRSRS
jgi:hypothetical protein